MPRNGPVEFHWYAAEEGGLLGSQAIARYKKEEGATIGAMMEFVSDSSRLTHILSRERKKATNTHCDKRT